MFAQCSPVSYLEKKNKKIKNQTQHHKKEKDIKIITIMKKQNKLNKKNIEMSYFIKHKNHFFKIINTIIYISHKKTCFFIKYKKKLKKK